MDVRTPAPSRILSRSKSASKLFSRNMRRRIISSVIPRSSPRTGSLVRDKVGDQVLPRSAMSTAVEKWPTAARLAALAAADHLPTAPAALTGCYPCQSFFRQAQNFTMAFCLMLALTGRKPLLIFRNGERARPRQSRDRRLPREHGDMASWSGAAGGPCRPGPNSEMRSAHRSAAAEVHLTAIYIYLNHICVLRKKLTIVRLAFN